MSRSFDAVDDYINCGSSSAVDQLANITVGCWVFKQNSNLVSQRQWISKSVNATSGGWVFSYATSNAFTFSVDYATADLSRVATQNAISSGNWVWVSAIWTGGTDAGSIKLYVNENEAKYNEANSLNGVGARSTDSKRFVSIGAAASTVGLWLGTLAYVHLYNRALSLNELIAIREIPGMVRNGLVGFWPLNDGSPEGNYALGISNNGILTGTTFVPNGPPISGMFVPGQTFLYG